jgi:aromatic ring-opening dioxygenase LigB subunit
MEQFHDPREAIRGLQQILINNTIRIGFLFGAGTSMAAYLTDKNGEYIYDERNRIKPLIPGVKKMTNEIISSITEEDFNKALDIIKEELEEAEEDERKKENVFMLENIISSIDQKNKSNWSRRTMWS